MYAVTQKICDRYIPEIGKPRRILSDHGTQFTSKRWKRSLEDLGIRVVFSLIRHPQGNPVERVMRELGRMFRALCANRHAGWACQIPTIERNFHLCTHLTTGFAPQEIHFGTPVKDEIQGILQFPEARTLSKDEIRVVACERMEQAFSMRKKGQGRITRISFAENDLVFFKIPHLSKAIDSVTHKFFEIYEGPFLIKRVLGNGSYELCEKENRNKDKGIHHHSKLRQ